MNGEWHIIVTLSSNSEDTSPGNRLRIVTVTVTADDPVLAVQQ